MKHMDIVYSPMYIVYSLLQIQCTVQFTLCTVQCTAQCTSNVHVYHIQPSLQQCTSSVHCAVQCACQCTVQCIVYSAVYTPVHICCPVQVQSGQSGMQFQCTSGTHVGTSGVQSSTHLVYSPRAQSSVHPSVGSLPRSMYSVQNTVQPSVHQCTPSMQSSVQCTVHYSVHSSVQCTVHAIV